MKKILVIFTVLLGLALLGCPNAGDGLNLLPGVGEGVKTVIGVGETRVGTIQGRDVTLSAYAMGKYEVTYRLWKKVCDWGSMKGYKFANPGQMGGKDSSIGEKLTDLHPVTEISWRDAIVWCNAYSEMEKKSPVYYSDAGFTKVLKESKFFAGQEAGTADFPFIKVVANGYRLPTEAEWEFAARGGDKDEADFLFPFAGSADEKMVAWSAEISESKSHMVGGKNANRLGLHDMSGNVFEWCWDWYIKTIPAGAVADPLGPDVGKTRVYRGGSWYGDSADCAVVKRFHYYAHNGNDDIGFRVACSLVK